MSTSSLNNTAFFSERKPLRYAHPMFTQKSAPVVTTHDINPKILQKIVNNGYPVMSARTPEETLELLTQQTGSLGVLHSPLTKSLGVASTLRKNGHGNPLLLALETDIEDLSSFLHAGFDDIITPQTPTTLLGFKMAALLKRTTNGNKNQVLAAQDITLLPQQRLVTKKGTKIRLTKTEFDLLECLMVNKNIVMSADSLYEKVWGITYEYQSKNLAVYIGYLRRKLGATDTDPIVETIRGTGYVIRDTK